MKLVNLVDIKWRMRLLSGLRIVGANDEIKIGGIDNPIIRDPFTNMPIIPGSSIKGVMRCNTEIIYGRERICNCGKCVICKLFGTSNNNDNVENFIGPGRLIIRDAKLTKESINTMQSMIPSMTEIKKENSISRVTGASGSLRTVDRVPAGAEFLIDITLRIFDNDKQEQLIDSVIKILKFLEHSYIGGSGTRGYGQVKFIGQPEISNFEVDKEVKQYLDKVMK